MKYKEQVLVSLYAVLHSQRYKKNCKEILRYKKFLEDTALPWVSSDRKNLSADTPKSIKNEYVKMKKKTRQHFLDTQKLFTRFNINKESLREFDNCPENNAAGTLGKSLLNLFHNFDNLKFNAEIDSRINELGGISNYSQRIIVNIESVFNKID